MAAQDILRVNGRDPSDVRIVLNSRDIGVIGNLLDPQYLSLLEDDDDEALDV